jgi:hypothetical protein
MADSAVWGVLSNIWRKVQQHNHAGLQRYSSIVRQPLLLYTIIWTMLLAAIVTIASISQEFAFSSSLSPTTDFSKACMTTPGTASDYNGRQALFRVALDRPGDVICLPVDLFVKSAIDYIVPPIFAAVVVAASACFLQAVGLWGM